MDRIQEEVTIHVTTVYSQGFRYQLTAVGNQVIHGPQ